MSCNIQYGHVFCTTSSSFAGLKNPKTGCLTLANSHLQHIFELSLEFEAIFLSILKLDHYFMP